MGWMFYIWLMILIVSVVVEIATTDLTSVWFAVGATVSLILNLFIKDKLIAIQIAVFAVVSIISIFLLRPILKKKMNAEKIPTNADALVGKTAIVTNPISDNFPGSIKIEGIEWTAICHNNSFEVGDFVEIVEITGNTMLVKEKN